LSANRLRQVLIIRHVETILVHVSKSRWPWRIFGDTSIIFVDIFKKMPSGFFPWLLRFWKLEKTKYFLYVIQHLSFGGFSDTGKCNMTDLQLCKWKQYDFDNKNQNVIILELPLGVLLHLIYFFLFLSNKDYVFLSVIVLFLSIFLMLAILISVILVGKNKTASWGPRAHNFGGPNLCPWIICTKQPKQKHWKNLEKWVHISKKIVWVVWCWKLS